MISTAKRLNLLTTVLVFSVGACGSDGTGAKPPSAIAPLGGNAQQAAVGDELANPLLVKVTDASGKALRGITVTWTVESGGGSASPAASATDGEGLATTRWRVGSTPGEQAITAAVAGVSAARFTATATTGAATTLVVAPDSAVLSALGDTVRFAARVADRFGNSVGGAMPEWASLDTAVLHVSGSGTVRARANGLGRIVATFEGKSDTAFVRVRQAAAALTVSPVADTLLVGGTVRLTAAARDANGFPIADPRAVWSSSDPSVATVDSTGLVQAQARGEATVSVTVDNVSARAVIQVVRGLSGPLSMGYSHGCAIVSGGEAYCWGGNASGELGAPSGDCGLGLPCSTTPLAVSGGLRFRAISNGQSWSCAITQSGEPYCWGYNLNGNLGNGTRTASAVPVRVSGGLTFAFITVGGSHSCALTAGGQAYCWGSNGVGVLGDGTTTDRLTPVRVNTTRTFKSLTAGNGHTCGIATTDELLCWGSNKSAQLGDGTVVGRLTPGVVAAGIAFASVSAGFAHTCGATVEGEVYCWGDNTFGQLGTQAAMDTCSGGFFGTSRCRKIPTKVAGGITSYQVSAGVRQTCAVSIDAAAYCWGDNSKGQLGAASDDTCSWFDTAYPCSLVPVRVGGGHSWSVVSTGQLSTCGGTTNGTVLCWGWNNGGQLGNGTRIDRSSPTRVALP